ncbi:MAG: hypothetical protein ACT6S0_13490 [Roseateles sp.]|uniref:hypothetical protein n=1 Tax=Roseateles sp. TaxID=1971397 RepID=UPI00403752BF
MNDRNSSSTGHATGRSQLAAGLAAAVLMTAMPAASAWEPAPEVSAQQILQDAQKDARDGRLAEAAEKFRWFHEHALERDRAMSGVRLSFALADWADLARRYPPAMAHLVAARDRALAMIDAGGRPGQMALGEVIRINARLKAHESTRDAFARFALRDPVLAERELLEALPALISLNEFGLASKHLRVEFVLSRMEGLHRAFQEAPLKVSDERKAQMLSHQQRYIDVKLARVVLALSKDGRDAEAEQVVARGQALLGPQARIHHMTEALRGVAPPDDDA